MEPVLENDLNVSAIYYSKLYLKKESDKDRITIQLSFSRRESVPPRRSLSKKLHALYRGDYDDSLALPLNHSDLDAACVVEKARGRGEKKLDCIEGKAKVDIAPAMTRTDRFAR